MKKILLACSLIAGGIFFFTLQTSFAQQGQQGTINVNACIRSNGNRLCLNTATGQYELVDAQGRGISGNANTGAIGGSGTIGGVRVTGGIGGSGTGGVGGAAGTGMNYSGPLGLLALAQTIVARLVPLLVGLAMLAFFWYLVMFIWQGSSNPDKQKEGKSGMFYSLLAIFVMVSLWGIIQFAGSVLGINQGGTISGFKLPGEN